MIGIAIIVIIAAVLAHSTTAVGSETLTCSVWQGIRTCSNSSGYVSHESAWNGITTGDDNQGNRWTTTRWMVTTTTTVTPPHR
jgi:hypothetical protein